MITNFKAILKTGRMPVPDNTGSYKPNALYFVINDNKTFTLHCTSDCGKFLYNQSALAVIDSPEEEESDES